jgi:hypothetical protein
MNLALVRSFWQPVFRTTLLTDDDPSARGARRRSAASRPRDGAEAQGFRSRMQSTQVADDALQTASRSYRKLVVLLPPYSSRSAGIGLHRTMAKVCKSDGDGTFAGTRGNGEVAPIPAIREVVLEPPGPNP